MDSFIIAPTEDSPSIIFDTTTNHFVVSGSSRPENAKTFYTPIMDWLTTYLESRSLPKQNNNEESKLIFTFRLEYFNSATAKCIVDILFILKKFVEQGFFIKIEWFCDQRDEDMLEMGNEFAEAVGLKLDYIQY
jgi:hypothetical protein